MSRQSTLLGEGGELWHERTLIVSNGWPVRQIVIPATVPDKKCLESHNLNDFGSTTQPREDTKKNSVIQRRIQQTHCKSSLEADTKKNSVVQRRIQQTHCKSSLEAVGSFNHHKVQLQGGARWWCRMLEMRWNMNRRKWCLVERIALLFCFPCCQSWFFWW